MRRNSILASIILLSLFFGSSVTATVAFDFSGQVRFRAEFDGKSNVDGSTTRQYNYLRTRINVGMNAEENTSAFIQFQDSRMQGQLTADDERSSGLLNDGMNVDLHQGYIKINQLWNNGIGLKAGRFEFNLGGQRVFGAVGWHNVGRAWDGVMLFRECDNRAMKIFWLKGLERNFEDYDGDFDIYGAQFTLKSLGIDLFGFYEFDGYQPNNTVIDGDDTTFTPAAIQTLKRWNFGAYGKWHKEDFDFELNAVLQTGKQLAFATVGDTLKATEYEVSAMMFAFEAGYSFDSECKPRLAIAIDFSSGDDKADNEIENYTNAYYTGHKFRGYMDNFIKSETPGLVDLIFRAKLMPFDGWTFKADAHYFMTAVDYIDFNSASSSDVGMELDLVASTNNIKGVGLALGGSLFFPSESYVGAADPDMTYWFFTQLTANFK